MSLTEVTVALIEGWWCDSDLWMRQWKIDVSPNPLNLLYSNNLRAQSRYPFWGKRTCTYTHTHTNASKSKHMILARQNIFFKLFFHRISQACNPNAFLEPTQQAQGRLVNVSKHPDHKQDRKLNVLFLITHTHTHTHPHTVTHLPLAVRHHSAAIRCLSSTLNDMPSPVVPFTEESKTSTHVVSYTPAFSPFTVQSFTKWSWWKVKMNSTKDELTKNVPNPLLIDQVVDVRSDHW